MATGEAAGAAAALAVAEGVDPPALPVSVLQTHLARAGAILALGGDGEAPGGRPGG